MVMLSDDEFKIYDDLIEDFLRDDTFAMIDLCRLPEFGFTEEEAERIQAYFVEGFGFFEIPFPVLLDYLTEHKDLKGYKRLCKGILKDIKNNRDDLVFYLYLASFSDNYGIRKINKQNMYWLTAGKDKGVLKLFLDPIIEKRRQARKHK